MLRERLKTPIMADESVSDFHSAGVVIREQACDSVNIKVGKVGGLTMAKKIAACLEAEGLLATAGSNLAVSYTHLVKFHESQYAGQSTESASGGYIQACGGK